MMIVLQLKSGVEASSKMLWPSLSARIAKTTDTIPENVETRVRNFEASHDS